LRSLVTFGTTRCLGDQATKSGNVPDYCHRQPTNFREIKGNVICKLNIKDTKNNRIC